jgi:hypothetical protein
MVTKSKIIQRLWLFLLILTPIVLWLLPSDFFDESKVILCPSRLFFDIECWGCGMTRAIMHLHHIELDDALYFNKGSFIVYPALVLLWFVWTKQSLKQIKATTVE